MFIKPLAININVKFSGFISPKKMYFTFFFFLKIQIKEPRIQIAQVENLKIKGFD